VIPSEDYTLDQPGAGRFVGTAQLSDSPEAVGAAHHLPVRVYFEDTDHSGLVYHANYLRYMERARSDMLRLAGIDQKTTHLGGVGVYAVADLSIKYLRPAQYDDALIVISRVIAIRAASVMIQQTIVRSNERPADTILTQATVHAAFLAPNGRPTRQPKDWIDIFTPLLNPDPAS
jgi:acyl-CoA thioester hydrolase